MEPFVKEPTVDTPGVLLDAEKGTFLLTRMSLPEDAVEVTIEKDLEKGFDYRRITVIS